MTEFTLAATISEPFDRTVVRVRELLADAGFGVLTEIDLQATLRTKLGAEIPEQVVLGACRPQLAHRALQADPRVATMLPCNVVVAALDQAHSRVEVFDPAIMTSFSAAPAIAELASDARGRLSAMMDALTTGPEEADAA